jgi:hypothetical protein
MESFCRLAVSLPQRTLLLLLVDVGTPQDPNHLTEIYKKIMAKSRSQQMSRKWDQVRRAIFCHSLFWVAIGIEKLKLQGFALNEIALHIFADNLFHYEYRRVAAASLTPCDTPRKLY